MFKKIYKFFIFILCFLTIDYLLSSLVLFKFLHSDLEKIYYSDIENRIPDKEYKYTFKSNSQFYSKYNDFVYKINTNNFGFRDETTQTIKPNKNKDLYFFAGDSFLEGVGLNFNETMIGKLKKKVNDNYIFLNSGVASYSPYLYKRKIISFIENNKNFKPKKIIILFDKSDPIDDLRFKNHKGNFKVNYNQREKIYQKKITEKFVSLSFLKLFANFLDEFQRNLKYRFKLSKNYELNFFDFTKNQVIAFKSIGNRKFITNFYTNKNIWNKKTKGYIFNSFNHIKDIEVYLAENNIELEIFIYPWPFELMNSEVSKKYTNLIEKISESKNLIVHNCYDYFYKEDNLAQLESIGRNYLFADVHYNSRGNEILSGCIKDKLKL
jgi:hypothetical protein